MINVYMHIKILKLILTIFVLFVRTFFYDKHKVTQGDSAIYLIEERFVRDK